MNKKVSGFKLLKVRRVLWERLKIMSAKSNISLQDATHRVLLQGLKYTSNLTANDNGK
jgi:hypothetical protein